MADKLVQLCYLTGSGLCCQLDRNAICGTFTLICYEKNFSTAQKKGNKNPRIPRKDGDRGRTSHFKETGAEGQTCFDLTVPVKMSINHGAKLRKREKLMEKAEYVRVLKKGNRVSSANFTLAVLENGLVFPRIGHVVAKKTVSHAVSRNKIKRYFREVFRLNKREFGEKDFIFIAKSDVSNLSLKTFGGEILRLINGEK